MTNDNDNGRGPLAAASTLFQVPVPLVLALLLGVALLAFELFNFDTTRFALASLLGDVRFLSVSWATILAVAFCAIDFAGLVRFFLPDTADSQRPEYWYLTGAWLLGATMNAIMTWWAVSLTLLNHELGNEILSRATLLEVVPIFVAALVWLTRILFIGSITVAGSHLFGDAQPAARPSAAARPAGNGQPLGRPMGQPVRAAPRPRPTAAAARPAQPLTFEGDEADAGVETAVSPPPPAARPASGIRPQGASKTRIRRRPPAPARRRPPTPAPMRAKGRGEG